MKTNQHTQCLVSFTEGSHGNVFGMLGFKCCVYYLKCHYADYFIITTFIKYFTTEKNKVFAK